MAKLPIAWEYRTFHNDNTVTPGWSNWERLEPRHEYSTIWDRVNEMQQYINRGNPYEIRPLYLSDQLTPRTKLTHQQIGEILPGGIYDCLGDPWDEGRGDNDTMHNIKTDVERIVRAVELAHGICDTISVQDACNTEILMDQINQLRTQNDAMKRILHNISVVNATETEYRKWASECLEKCDEIESENC